MRPVSHKIYGIPQTINSANYVYFLAYQQLFSLRGNSDAESDPKRLVSPRDLDRIVTCELLRFCAGHAISPNVNCYIAELLSLHRGQGLEILWRDSLQCPTEEQYITMVNNSALYTTRPIFLLLDSCLQRPVGCSGWL